MTRACSNLMQRGQDTTKSVQEATKALPSSPSHKFSTDLLQPTTSEMASIYCIPCTNASEAVVVEVVTVVSSRALRTADVHQAYIQLAYEMVGYSIGIFLPSFIALFYGNDEDESLDYWIPYWAGLSFSSFQLSIPLTQLVIHFDVPLPFGYRIPAISSSVCTLENDPNALPCILRGLLDWGMRFLDGKRGAELGALRLVEEKFLRHFWTSVIMLILAWIACLPLFRCAWRCHKEGERRKRKNTRKIWRKHRYGQKIRRRQ